MQSDFGWYMYIYMYVGFTGHIHLFLDIIFEFKLKGLVILCINLQVTSSPLEE